MVKYNPRDDQQWFTFDFIIKHGVTKRLFQRTILLMAVVAIFWMPVGQQAQTNAEETKLVTNSVNDIELQIVFHFREADEIVDTFKVFDTLSSGFDRTKGVTFMLEGVVGGDRPILYKAIDETFYHGKNVQHYFSEFDVDVILHQGEQQYRKITYSDCQIKNYNVFTEFDKEETFSEKTKFAIVDKIEFDCRGFALGNPSYEKILEEQKAERMAKDLENLEHVQNNTGH